MAGINKTNAARLLDRAKIPYSLIPYEVDENDLAGLAVGMEASVGLDGAPGESIRARLERISRAANDRGEYDVTFSLEQSDALRIGMSATATLK